MTKYESITLKLKMVELTQNQSMIELTASLVDTPASKTHSLEAANALQTAIGYAEKMLDIR